ncbi:MAG: hypothetical protein ACM36C_04400 [Acidobacteriota bacterium]
MAETLPLAATLDRLRIPADAYAMVLVAQGDAAADHAVTEALHHAQLATLSIAVNGPDVLNSTARVRRLTGQLVATAEWVSGRADLAKMRVGIFGAGIAGGAALAAASSRPDVFRALVLSDSRPHLTGSVIHDVQAATLLIVNAHDDASVSVNRETMSRVKGIAELEVLPESPLANDDPETMAQVAQLARRWFIRFLS